MKFTICILLCFLTTFCKLMSWDEYKEKYGLNFSDHEESMRIKIYEDSCNFIESENSKGKSYKLGINQFAHLTRQELKRMFMMPMPIDMDPVKNNKLRESDESIENESWTSGNMQESLDVDWRKKNYVTSVKNQGLCGAGYVFATTANLESARAMKTGVLQDLSVQMTLNCAYNNGCDYGSDYFTYMFLKFGGAVPWNVAPYLEKKQECHFPLEKVVTRSKAKVYVKGGTEAQLTRSILKRPTTVRIHADVRSFHFYSSGTYADDACTPDVIDHLAMIVGVVQNKTHNYYILKNSWGTSWGMDGYMHLGRGRKNNCGVSSSPSYVVMP